MPSDVFLLSATSVPEPAVFIVLLKLLFCISAGFGILLISEFKDFSKITFSFSKSVPAAFLKSSVPSSVEEVMIPLNFPSFRVNSAYTFP